jgi:ribosome-associated protein
MRAKKSETRKLTELPEILQSAIAILADRQVDDVSIYDQQGTSVLNDYCLICTGRSAPHIRAIVKHLEKLFKENDKRPLSIEGTPASRWVLMDYGDIIIHIFDPETREFYELESLFGPASCVYPE